VVPHEPHDPDPAVARTARSGRTPPHRNGDRVDRPVPSLNEEHR